MTHKHAAFSITDHKGVRIRFDNGYSISIQWGPANYGSHHHMLDISAPQRVDLWRAAEAEIALFDADENWVTEQAHQEITGMALGDQVIGWLTPDKVLPYIVWAQAQGRK